MNTTKKISINEAPKAFRLFYILLPVIGLLVISRVLDNDFYFLYPTGEYIVNNGFPVKDFLSMHTDMNIVVQQWATDVLYYFIYSKLGLAGIIGFVYICYIIFATLMFKLCKLICDNEFIAAMCAFGADIIAAKIYMYTRPQAISYILFVLEMFALESFVKTKKVRFLAILPLISLALVNFHASMWVMMFIFALPYAAAALPINIKKIKQEPCCSFVKLLITGAICFAVGFINPYGIKSMTYIFTSFGYKDINEYIGEMEATSVSSSLGVLYFVVLFALLGIIIFTRKNNFSTRFVLMFAGSAALAVMNYKSIGYFLVLGVPAFSYYLKDVEPMLTVDESKKKKTAKDKIELAALAVLLVAAISGAVFYVTYTDSEESKVQQSETLYDSLDVIIEELDKDKGDDMVLYTCFDLGPYFEFYGYHPYIDCRAELFFKKNNGVFDYYSEHMDCMNGKLYYKDFLEKYKFTHVVVLEEEYCLYNGLINDEDYELVLKTKSKSSVICLFERK